MQTDKEDNRLKPQLHVDNSSKSANRVEKRFIELRKEVMQSRINPYFQNMHDSLMRSQGEEVKDSADKGPSV